MATLLICLIFGVPKMSHQSVFKIFKKKKGKIISSLLWNRRPQAGLASWVGSLQSQGNPYTEATQAKFSTLMSPS